MRHHLKNPIRLWTTSFGLTLTLVFSFGTEAFGQNPSDVASQIDALIDVKIVEEQATVADRCSDSEFIRRIYLDVAGKIPPVSRVREFLNDKNPDKRDRLVDELLESSRYVVNFTTMWRNALIPEAIGDLRLRQAVPGFEAWLRKALADDLSYDEFVRRIIDAPLNPNGTPAQYVEGDGPTAAGFYLAKEGKPESLASATSRVFLGRRIECAQCHDHPFDEWKQEQFWQFAAFFSGTDPTQNMMAAGSKLAPGTIKIPDSDDTVKAAFLKGSEPDFKNNAGARAALAGWVVNENNPYFAEMGVNRLWGHFFSRGLVEPVDDFSANNPASHPKLLKLLADEFTASDFDLKFMIRTITATKAYQRSSRQTHESQAIPELFARMSVKGLTEEQVFDTIAESVGFFEAYRADEPFVLQQNTPRAEFLELFRNDSDSRAEQQTTILQALAMMNGDFLATQTNIEQSQTLAAIANSPFMTDADRVETLFLSTLSRKPTQPEREKFVSYVQSGGATKDSKAALTDVFWALLNSSEFLLNH
ncbi:MAG: DUF1549 and DUF1553 domain-containing protein [Planctomycetaceae bacterium]